MLLILALAVLLCALCALAKRPFEALLPLMAGACMLLCYGLALCQGLALFPWIAYGLGLASLGWMGERILTGGGRALLGELKRYVLTPGMVSFAGLALFLAFAMGDHVVTATDDIHYWAIEAKSLYARQGLTGWQHHLAPRFMTYTPGMQLLQWIGLTAAGEFSEGALFVQLTLFYMVFLLPFARRITWRKAYCLPLLWVFALGIPTVVFRDAYTMLRVDAALGVCLGSALCQAWELGREEKPSWWEALTLALTLSTLALVKQIGGAWVLAPLSLLLLRRRHTGLSLGQGLTVAALPALAAAGWLVFIQVQGLTGTHLSSMIRVLKDAAAGQGPAMEQWGALPAALWGAFTYSPSALLGQEETLALLVVPMLGWMILFPAAPLLLAWRLKRRSGAGKNNAEKEAPQRLSLWWVGCLGVMILAFVALFATAFEGGFDSFIEATPPRLFYLLERYLGPLFLGGLLLGIHIAMETRALGRWGLGAAALGLVLLVQWGQLYDNLAPGRYQGEEPLDMAMYRDENFWVEDVYVLERPLDAVILYGIDPTPLRPERLQYPLAPLKILTFYGGMEPESLARRIRDYGITHLVTMDAENPTYEAALAFAQDGYLDAWTLYRVDWEGEEPVLVAEGE